MYLDDDNYFSFHRRPLPRYYFDFHLLRLKDYIAGAGFEPAYPSLWDSWVTATLPRHESGETTFYKAPAKTGMTSSGSITAGIWGVTLCLSLVDNIIDKTFESVYEYIRECLFYFPFNFSINVRENRQAPASRWDVLRLITQELRPRDWDPFNFVLF